MAKHPPKFLAPESEDDLRMKTINFILFYVLSIVVGMFQIPWNMRSLKKNGPSFSASLVLLFGIVFSTLFDIILFGGEHRGFRGIFGAVVFTIGVYFIGYEKYLFELEQKGTPDNTYNKIEEGHMKRLEELDTEMNTLHLK